MNPEIEENWKATVATKESIATIQATAILL
jgi:hypothetical protein